MLTQKFEEAWAKRARPRTTMTLDTASSFLVVTSQSTAIVGFGNARNSLETPLGHHYFLVQRFLLLESVSFHARGSLGFFDIFSHGL